MPLNRRKPNPDSLLYSALSSLYSPDELFSFLTELCSPAELISLEQRFEVAALLLQDASYVDIMAQAGVSSATISRVKRAMVDQEGVVAKVIREAKLATPKA